MNLEELISKSMEYDNHNYGQFIKDYLREIVRLSQDDQFILLKELYVTAKFGCECAADLLQSYGVPDSEIDNIKKNICFDENGEVTVYRGLDGNNDFEGSSFTLDKERAIWFSTRLKADGAEPQLVELNVIIDDIIFYDNSRGEQEVFLTNDVIGREWED